MVDCSLVAGVGAGRLCTAEASEGPGGVAGKWALNVMTCVMT